MVAIGNIQGRMTKMGVLGQLTLHTCQGPHQFFVHTEVDSIVLVMVSSRTDTATTTFLGGFSNRGVSHFFGKAPDYVVDPFGNVPCK